MNRHYVSKCNYKFNLDCRVSFRCRALCLVYRNGGVEQNIYWPGISGRQLHASRISRYYNGLAPQLASGIYMEHLCLLVQGKLSVMLSRYVGDYILYWCWSLEMYMQEYVYSIYEAEFW